ncbi:MAG: sensor histidine kinase [Actinomycetota bacterium]|nr:sensor histidine kinase [Actinomycetota bacterium]
MPHIRPGRGLAGDALLALALAVFGVVGTAGADANAAVEPDRALDGYGIVLVVATALTLAVRRSWPLVVLALAAVGASTYLLAGYTYGPILVSLMVAVYTAARHLPLRTSLPACVVAMLLLLTHIFTNNAALPGFLGLVPGSAWVVVPFALGLSVRQARVAAERSRAELVRERVADERLRVAQEVHDVVGHGLAAIKMQADIALHVADRKPEQAATALTAISRTSTEALEELRATLALVRRDADDADARTPLPGLGRLDDLEQRMSHAGLSVRVSTTGTPVGLPPQVDLAAYRVVQEALTNVLRHSPATVARVQVDYETDAVALTVTSSGTAEAERAGGLGMPGMRGRVESLGGTFSAGPTAGGSFEVRARLPIGEQT